VFTRPDRLPAAIRELQAILATEPRSALAHVLLGLAHVQQGLPDMLGEAVAEFRQALAIDPTLTAARFYLARAYLDLSQPGRAREEMIAALKQAPRQPAFIAVLAEAERRLGRPQLAVDVAQEGLAIDPSFAQARYYLSLALIDLDRRADAIQQLEHLGRTAPAMADVFFTLGGAYLDDGRVDLAISALTHGITIRPPSPEVRVQLARAYRLKGDTRSANEQLNLAFPPGASIQVSASYQRLEANYQLERGLTRLQEARLDEAAAALRTALEIKPDVAAAHRALADVYLRQGRAADAAGHIAQADRLSAAEPVKGTPK
jgi:tetratricopeptide (TPR) repeat protein